VAKTQEPEESHTFLTKPEEEWCAVHNLVPAAFKNISEICMSSACTLAIYESIRTPSTLPFSTIVFVMHFSNIYWKTVQEIFVKGSLLGLCRSSLGSNKAYLVLGSTRRSARYFHTI
jgi:hypothetical protein